MTKGGEGWCNGGNTRVRSKSPAQHMLVVLLALRVVSPWSLRSTLSPLIKSNGKFGKERSCLAS